MNEKIKITFLITSLLLAANTVLANNLETNITEIEDKCVQFQCEAPLQAQILYRFSDTNKAPFEREKEFAYIAYEQAQIWGDTILEGDYVAEGNTRLDRVEVFKKNNEVLAYLVTYSEKAWDTSDCQYDGINNSTLVDCTAGRIVEGSYVSPDLKTVFYTEKTMARFK